MTWIEPVTDRTDPNTEWGYDDVQRIINNYLYLQEELLALGYSTVLDYVEFDLGEFPLYEKIQKIEHNVEVIKNVLPIIDDVPNLDFITVEQANLIEQILKDVEILRIKLTQAFYYADEIYAGENG